MQVALWPQRIFQDGCFIVCRYNMTCYSNTEEKMNELMWRDKLQYKLETALKDSGANMQEAYAVLMQGFALHAHSPQHFSFTFI